MTADHAEFGSSTAPKWMSQEISRSCGRLLHKSPDLAGISYLGLAMLFLPTWETTIESINKAAFIQLPDETTVDQIFKFNLTDFRILCFGKPLYVAQAVNGRVRPS